MESEMKTTENPMKKIGARIEERRKNLSLSTAELANKCHLSSGYISEVELGEKVPPLPILKRIAYALSITTAELIHGDGVFCLRIILVEISCKNKKGACMGKNKTEEVRH